MVRLLDKELNFLLELILIFLLSASFFPALRWASAQAGQFILLNPLQIQISNHP